MPRKRKEWPTFVYSERSGSYRKSIPFSNYYRGRSGAIRTRVDRFRVDHWSLRGEPPAAVVKARWWCEFGWSKRLVDFDWPFELRAYVPENDLGRELVAAIEAALRLSRSRPESRIVAL